MPEVIPSAGRATHGIRLRRGVVTHFGSRPITSRAMAERVWRLIYETTGDEGDIVEVVAQLDMTPDEDTERLHRESE